MSEIEVPSFKSWQSDWEENQAPTDALLRSDNIIADAAGARVLRPGIRRLGSALDGPVYTEHTGYVNGLKQRIVVAGKKAYLNGGFLCDVDGDGDAAIDAYLDSIFFARGTTKRRHNGTSLKSWGPGQPLSPGADQGGVAEATISTFDSGESPAWVAKVGTIADTTDSEGTSNSAKQVTIDKRKKSTIQRTFSTEQNYSTPNNYEEDSSDMISIDVYITDPENSKDITFEFGIGTGADPFKGDKFQFILPLNGTPLSKLPGARPSVGSKFSLYSVPLNYKQNAINKANATLVNSTTTPQPKTGATGDEGWSTIAIPRSAFFRAGKKADKGWNTVRAVRITYTAKKAGGIVRYDDFKVLSTGKALFGKYQFRVARYREAGSYIEVGPPSPASPSIFLALQGVDIFIPPQELTSISDPVLGWDGYFVYGQGGALDVFYKLGSFAAIGAGQGMRIDEFSRAANNTNGFSRSERTRFVNFGFSGPGYPVSGSLTAGLTAKIGCDEVEVLIRNEVLEESEDPANNMIDCDHHLDRMWQLTSELLTYSPVREAGRFLSDLALRVGDTTERPYWLKRTRSAIFVGTSKDIIRISGSGQTFPDRTVDFQVERLNIPNPPVGAGVVADGNLIFYQAEDGPRVFNGETSSPIDKGGNSLLWRGFTRHGILPIAVMGRHRYSVNDGYLYIVVPHGTFTGGSVYSDRKNGMRIDEFAIKADGGWDLYERTRHTSVGFTSPAGGASTVIWRNKLGTGNWDRMAFNPSFASIYSELDGTLLAGATDGYLYSLLHPDRGDHTEAQSDQSRDLDTAIQVQFRTPSYIPSKWGRMFIDELQALVETDPGCSPILGGGGLYVDGLLADSFGITGAGGFGYYRKQFDNIEGRSIQVRNTVNALQYNLKSLRLNFLPRPPSQIRYDSGLYLPEGAEDMVWLFEVRFLARLNVDLKLDLYMDDELRDTFDIVKQDGIKSYEQRIPKGIRGYVTRAILRTTVGESKQELHAFEVYWFEFAISKTGNQDRLERKRFSPA